MIQAQDIYKRGDIAHTHSSFSKRHEAHLFSEQCYI